jgi:hypothetical protein
LKTFQRIEYVFTSNGHCVVYRNIASCNTNHFFFGAEIFNPQKKKSTKIKCLLFSPKPLKFHTAEITGYTVYHIGGVMVGVITSSAVDRGFKPRSCQTKDYKVVV